jgi:hypothetical protein
LSLLPWTCINKALFLIHLRALALPDHVCRSISHWFALHLYSLSLTVLPTSQVVQ